MKPETFAKGNSIASADQPMPKVSWLRRLLDRCFERWIPANGLEEFEWQQDANRAFIEQDPLRARALLYGLALVVSLLVVWASLAEIDQVTRGQGKVIPSRQVQIIQSQDGGSVSEIHVAEGDIVEVGQLLVKLDKTRFVSSYRESRAEYLALQAKAARLEAVAEGKPFVPSQELLDEEPEIIAQESALYKSSLAELDAARSISQQQLIQREQELIEITARRDQLANSFELANRELTLTRPLVETGAVSEVELLRLEREVNQLQGEWKQADAQIVRIQSSIFEAQRKTQEVELVFINRVREELSLTMANISSLKEGSAGLSDRVKQTAVRSPVRGTVKQLYTNTIGGVVLPGKEIAEIVPLDDTLLLEAKIQPKDIGFLRPGQEAMVKFTAYDFVVYGGLEAVVEHIGADTIMDEKGNPFYIVRVRTHAAKFSEDMPIIPGMVAEVGVLTGKKTILASLLKPVLRAKQRALTER